MVDTRRTGDSTRLKPTSGCIAPLPAPTKPARAWPGPPRGRYLLRELVVQYLTKQFPKWTAIDKALESEVGACVWDGPSRLACLLAARLVGAASQPAGLPLMAGMWRPSGWGTSAGVRGYGCTAAVVVLCKWLSSGGRLLHVCCLQGWKLVTLLRLSPIAPWNVLNYALSVTAVPLLPYCLASALAVSCRCSRLCHLCIARSGGSSDTSPAGWLAPCLPPA